ncbi:MAG: UvrD-helicase domain-containing protein [Bdellovibrionaceae bacterium]|nr:UvrD-helicase domain-containing protein [Pseudobdellovibrionaceae bacterium]
MSNLSTLNPTQQQAATHFGSPLLIIAGAGSGKTRVLTHKISHLVETGSFQPQNILAVTFTNKAAREMKDRVATLLPPHLAYSIWISTFHSLGVQILRRYALALGYKTGFSIYDDNDQISVLKKVLKKLNINEKIITPKFCQSRINLAKSQCLTMDQIAQQRSLFNKEFSHIYSHYETELKTANAFDFGDLIAKNVYLIEHHPEIREELQRQFQYILVDEYQDTNVSQYRLMRGLCGNKNNICVVGDEDQSIYAWRGADITNILNFEKDFPGTKLIKLEQNYRSTKNILSAAYEVIKNNTQRRDKKLFTENPDGEKVKIVEVENEYDEARFVAEKITILLGAGVSPSEIAVFYRTNAQSRVLEEQLRTKDIHYKMYGGMRFYDRKEIKDVASYLNLLLNPTDDVCLKRVINVPARGLGKTSVEAIETIGIERGVSLVEAAMIAIKEKVLNSRASKKVAEFLDLLVSMRSLVETHDLYALYNEVLLQTGYLKELESDDTIESQSRIENLQEFGNAILRFTETHRDDATLERFLSDTALMSDQDQDTQDLPSVTLMTLHISKGLEFPYVFMVGMEDGLFPSAQSLEDTENKLEEERRLCYVGMTRAEKVLFMSYARSRRHWGDQNFNPPSRFIDEIPAEYLESLSLIQKRPQFMNRYSNSSNYGSTDNFDDSKPSRNGFSNRSASSAQNDVFPDYENLSDSYSDNPSPYRKGAQVRHPVFGAGSIFQVEGTGDSMKVSILFRDKSLKKFIVKHANLTFI